MAKEEMLEKTFIIFHALSVLYNSNIERMDLQNTLKQ